MIHRRALPFPSAPSRSLFGMGYEARVSYLSCPCLGRSSEVHILQYCSKAFVRAQSGVRALASDTCLSTCCSPHNALALPIQCRPKKSHAAPSAAQAVKASCAAANLPSAERMTHATSPATTCTYQLNVESPIASKTPFVGAGANSGAKETYLPAQNRAIVCCMSPPSKRALAAGLAEFASPPALATLDSRRT
eukprot:scaffold256273_cov40-Tisochrysis_lutea.AAC.2